MRGWSKFKDKKWRRVLQLALQPVTVGTVLASAWIISEAAAINTLLIIMVVIATLLSLIKSSSFACFDCWGCIWCGLTLV